MQTVWQGQWNSEEETALFGRSLARGAKPGDCLALVGDMGAGKTTLTRAIAEELGVNIREQFGSPTYTYVNEYQGRHGLMVHIDLYRVADEATAFTLGMTDSVMRPDAIVIVEWADKLVPLMPAHTLWLRITPSTEHPSRRTWKARAPIECGTRLLGRPGDEL